jgi:flagellar export protein FliJ
MTGIDKTLKRLISIKREALEALRRDLGQLDRLCCDAADVLAQAEQQWREAHADAIRRETAGNVLSVLDLMAWRRHLTVIADQVGTHQLAKLATERQRNQAREVLIKMYQEVRALERVGQRRQARRKVEEFRKEFTARDDQELMRRSRVVTPEVCQ